MSIATEVEGLSTAELLDRLRALGLAHGCTEQTLLQLLEQDRRRGIVERIGEAWRLTPKAQAEYGAALALLLPEA